MKSLRGLVYRFMVSIKNKREDLSRKWISLRFYLGILLFYKCIFSLPNILKGFFIYLFYFISPIRKVFNPLTVNFLITSACNFQCDICNFSNRDAIPDYLSVQDIEIFVRSLPRIKPIIFFSGGEPFLRADFLDILRVIKKYKLKCGINTNAYLLDEVKIRELLGLNIELLIFSLFGPEPIHDQITGIKGSYAKVFENMHLFCSKKNKSTRVILSCVITKSNIDYLEEIPIIAKRLKADAVKFEHLNFLDSSKFERNVRYLVCNRDNANMPLSDFSDSKASLTECISKKLEKVKRKYEKFIFIKPDLSKEEIRNWYSNEFRSKRKCFFIWHSIFIRPDGEAVPCQFLQHYELGNMREYKLCDIVKSARMVHLKKLLKKQLLLECARCCKL